MTTTYTHQISALIPYAQAEEVAQAIAAHSAPMGECFFDPSHPTHYDDQGGRWIYVRSVARESFVLLAQQIVEHFPDVKLQVSGAVVPTEDIGDRRTVWRGGKKAMVELVSQEEFLDGVTSSINLNEDPKAKIQALPGVGPSLAQRIIDHRPYQTVAELVDVQGISQSMVDGWEVMV